MEGGRDKPTRGLGWLASNPLSAAALVGATLYALLRINYLLFYAPLGVSPEEVGVDFAEVLSLAGPGLFLLFIFSLTVCVTVGAIVVALAALSRVGARLLKLAYGPFVGGLDNNWVNSVVFYLDWITPSEPLRVMGFVRWLSLRGLLMALLLSAAIVNLEMGLTARRFARVAAAGQEVREVTLRDIPIFPWPRNFYATEIPGLRNWDGVLSIPVLNVRATPVRVGWMGDLPQGKYITDLDCAMYLGHSSGVTVFYVLQYRGPGRRVGAAARVPSSEIMTTATESCPADQAQPNAASN